ncbi:hypothetical protein [uncultured Fusobacterium sp.]|uniref:hypothetical protein n=1 Tax=uncultured Fusobacterium sp. TaxID=159267 RepID=UPI00265D7DA0|nr:hypothetical protein [uncultured Fusobacterium sp.]
MILLIILSVLTYLITVLFLVSFLKTNYTRVDSICILILTFMFCLAMIIDFNGINKENMENFNEVKCYCEW